MSVMFTAGLILILSVSILALILAGFLIFSENSQLFLNVKNEIFLNKKTTIETAQLTTEETDSSLISLVSNSVESEKLAEEIDSSMAMLKNGLIEVALYQSDISKLASTEHEDFYRELVASARVNMVVGTPVLFKPAKHKHSALGIQVLRDINQKMVKPMSSEPHELIMELKDSQVYTSTYS